MAIEIVADLEVVKPSSPEWLALRKEGIGGSDAGAICGIGYRTPYQVWAEKVNPVVLEEEEPEYMRWGKLLEDPVRAEFSRADRYRGPQDDQDGPLSGAPVHAGQRGRHHGARWVGSRASTKARRPGSPISGSRQR